MPATKWAREADCHLFTEQDHGHAAADGAGAVRDARDVQVTHGLLVVDDVRDHRRQRLAHLAPLPRHEHLEAQPHRVQVDALRLAGVREAGCGRGHHCYYYISSYIV